MGPPCRAASLPSRRATGPLEREPAAPLAPWSGEERQGVVVGRETEGPYRSTGWWAPDERNASCNARRATRGADAGRRGSSRRTDEQETTSHGRHGLRRLPMARRLRDVMTSNPVCMDKQSSVQQAAQRMRDDGIGDILVTEGERV